MSTETNLHDKIKGLIGRHDEWRTTSVNEQRAYRAGHRDARHAAAELASEYEASQDALVAQLVEALEELLSSVVREHGTHGFEGWPDVIAARAALAAAQKGER